jgi:hypothetical protein
MEHIATYHLELNPVTVIFYASIFIYGIVAGVRDLYKLLNRWFG